MDGNPVAPDDEQGKEDENNGRADIAQLLAGDGEDVVVFGLREIGGTSAGVAQAHAQQAAGANGVEGLNGLVALAQVVAQGSFQMARRLAM